MPRHVLPLDLTLRTVSPLPPDEAFAGIRVRGMLVSALHFRSCVCTDAGAVRRGHHQAPCPLAVLLGTTTAGGRRLALQHVQQTGDTLTARLLLAGDAIAYADVVADAIDSLLEHGIGPGRIPVVEATLRRPADPSSDAITVYDSQDRCYRDPGEPAPVEAPWRATALATPDDRVTLVLASPLDLGWHEAPEPSTCCSLAGLGRAAIRRWARLSERPEETGIEHALPPEATAWLDALAAVSATTALTWSTTDRVSARQRRRMPLRGLVGTVTAPRTHPVTQLATAVTTLPPGARTAFGFGTITVDAPATTNTIAP